MNGNSKCDVCIIGLGPAGIGAALTLANSSPTLRILCFDAGTLMDNKHCLILKNKACGKHKPCSIISGIGGSSLLSGHKISAFPAGSNIGTVIGTKDLANKKLTEALRILKSYLTLQKTNITKSDICFAQKLFAKKGFIYRYYDSYLCDQKSLKHAYNCMLSKFQKAGIDILLNSEVTDIIYENNHFILFVRKNAETFQVTCKYLIIGVGRLGRNFLKSLNKKLNLGGKENQLEIGVRLEFPQKIYPDIDKYHNDLKLLYKDIRSFCVCKGGKLAPYYLDDIFIIDGYYNPAEKTNFTNLAIVLRLESSNKNDKIFYEIKNKLLEISSGVPIRQMLTDYLNSKTNREELATLHENSISFWVEGKIGQCFPEYLSKKIQEGVYKFVSATLHPGDWGKVSVFAPVIEYGGLNFPIGPDFSILPKMYLTGDCTGRFRGILQAFCSGLICAQNIVASINHEKYK
jgi:uncharacterized FAD-dependent dehydrogenase